MQKCLKQTTVSPSALILKANRLKFIGKYKFGLKKKRCKIGREVYVQF